MTMTVSDRSGVPARVARQIIDSGEGRLSVLDLSGIGLTDCRRIFTVSDVPAGAVRGCHAHRLCRQLLFSLAGSILLRCQDDEGECETVLTPDSDGALVPAGIWAQQTYLDEGAVLLVLCDRSYEEEDYIRNWDQFLEFRAANPGLAKVAES